MLLVACLLTMDSRLPSPSAQLAYSHAAVKLLNWLQDASHRAAFPSFAGEVVAQLKGCFPSTMRSAVAAREVLWIKFHKLRSSQDIHLMWSTFFQLSIETKSTPFLYQYLTEKVFEQLIIQQYPVQKPPKQEVSQLTYKERNALRYAAGYIP